MRKYLHLSLADKATVIGIVFILVAFLIFVLYPLIYVIIGSFMDPNQLNASGLSFDFNDYRLDGYRKILSDSAIGRGFLMSLFYSSAFTIVTVSVSLTLAFPLSRMDFVGRKLISALLLITMFFSGGLIPTYILVRELNMLDTVWALILPNAVNAWNIILARTFFRQLPQSLRESAELDGANNWDYFVKIALPLSKPIIAVLSLYAFVGLWNSYFEAMIYLEDRKLAPLQLVLRSILIQNEVPPGMISSKQLWLNSRRLVK